MAIFGFLILVLVGWAAYWVFISGPGNTKIFVEYHKDHNVVRKEIQDQGGIHKVEGDNIRRLEDIGYEVTEYYENAVELVKTADRRRSKVTLIHAHSGKKLIGVSYHKRGQEREIFSFKDPVREDEDAVESLHRHVGSFITSSRSSVDGDRLRRHFSITTDEPASEDTESPRPETSPGGGSAESRIDSEKMEMTFDRPGSSTILAKTFLASYTVLSTSQMERLRQGEKITLEDVELGAILNHQNSGDSRSQTFLFNVVAASAASALDEIAYLNDDQEVELRWADVDNLDVSTAADFTRWQSDGPLPKHQQMAEDMSAKIVIEMDELPDGSETIRCTNFVRKKETDMQEKTSSEPDETASESNREAAYATSSGNNAASDRSAARSRLRGGEATDEQASKLHEAMNLSEYDPESAGLDLQELKEKFRIIDPEGVKTLRDGRRLFIGGVPMSDRVFADKPNVKSILLFNVMTEGALTEARTIIDEGDNDQISYAELGQINLCGALFEERTDNPLSPEDTPLEGQKANVAVDLTKENGQLTLRVKDFNPGPHKDHFLSYPLNIDGVSTRLSPRRYSSQNDLISIGDFESWFTLLSHKESCDLRRGGTVELKNVRLQEIEILTGIDAHDDLDVQRRYYFSVLAKEDLSDLDRVAIARDHQVYIDYYAFKNTPFYFRQSLPSYSSLTEADPLPNHDLTIGDRCDISLTMTDPTIVASCDP